MWDTVWYVAGRVCALAITATTIAIVVADHNNVADSKARAEAAHRAILASHMRKSEKSHKPASLRSLQADVTFDDEPLPSAAD